MLYDLSTAANCVASNRAVISRTSRSEHSRLCMVPREPRIGLTDWRVRMPARCWIPKPVAKNRENHEGCCAGNPRLAACGAADVLGDWLRRVERARAP